MTKREILQVLEKAADLWPAACRNVAVHGVYQGLLSDLAADVRAEEAEAGPEPEPRTFTLILPRGFRMLVVRED